MQRQYQKDARVLKTTVPSSNSKLNHHALLIIAIAIFITSTVTGCASSNNANVTSTLLKIEFPFEPAPPGYLVNIKSKAFTANLMCAVENGEILDLGENSDDTKILGKCDTSSMTLNIGIPDEMTVTIILGGFPIVDEVTKSPDKITGEQAEYIFESSLP